jgi:hypothetical protein
VASVNTYYKNRDSIVQIELENKTVYIFYVLIFTATIRFELCHSLVRSEIIEQENEPQGTLSCSERDAKSLRSSASAL